MAYAKHTPEAILYRIVCRPTGRNYVGSTVAAQARWRCHQVDLQAGRHKNRFLQFAWNKHGRDAFTFEVLMAVPETRMIECEAAAIKALDCMAPRGFNIAAPHDAGVHTARDYVLISPRGKVRHVHRLAQWCRDNGFEGAHGNFTRIAQGKKHSHRGWKCYYAKVGADGVARYEVPALRGIPRLLRPVKVNHGLAKSYIVTHPDGREEAVTNLNEFADRHGLEPSSLAYVARGKFVSLKGWRCRYAHVTAKQRMKVDVAILAASKMNRSGTKIVDPVGRIQVIPWCGISAWCRETGVHPQHLYDVLHGRRRSVHGYTSYQLKGVA